MNNEDKIRHYQADLGGDLKVLEYLRIELDRIKRRAKKTEMTIEELKLGKK